jgi:hypothetical protein
MTTVSRKRGGSADRQQVARRALYATADDEKQARQPACLVGSAHVFVSVPDPLLAPTWVTAAFIVLAVGAIVIAIFACLAFRK